MIKLIKIDSVVVVEGKYDKIHLENFIDAHIIATNGFGIYKDKSKQKLLRQLCNKNGLVIITDSDSAGAQIRGFLKGFCDNEKITNVYLPQIKGTEKRKTAPSKEGFLGTEGLSGEIILKALKKSGVTATINASAERITKTDLFDFGLSGCVGSKAARDSFCNFIDLPIGLSPNAFLDALNSVLTPKEYLTEVRKWQQEQAKN